MPQPPGPGDRFPDLRLTDHAGHLRELSQLVGGDPTVLHFFRGWWCPKEQAFLRRLTAFQDEVEVAYANIVSVSVDSPQVTAAFRAGLGARWTFLTDATREHTDALGLRELTDTTNDPYLPTVFVLDPGLVVERRYDGYWYWGRPGLEELRADLREVTRRLRPDFDPPRP